MSSNVISTGDRDLVEVIERLFGQLEPGDEHEFDAEVWGAVTTAELHLIGLPEARGGAGGTLADFCATVFHSSRFPAAVPLVENYLAQWARARSGMDVSPGVALMARQSSASGTGAQVGALSWAPQARELLIVDSDAEVPSMSLRSVSSWRLVEKSRRFDLAGRVSQDVEIATAVMASASEFQVDRAEYLRLANLLRAAQLAGGVRGCLDVSRQYAAERHQFGVAINSFPAVQLHLVQLAQASSISRVAVFRAVAAIEGGSPRASEIVNSARLIASRAARDAIRCAHQLHGAIGMTREYKLARVTRSLHWWRLIDNDPAPEAAGSEATYLQRVWA